MRLALLLTIALLGLIVAACGSSSKSPGANGTSSSATTKRDRDDDGDDNDDDAHVLDYGRAPSASEKQALETLILDYYAASATEDGAKACRLLMPFVAESVVENTGHEQNLEGKSCAVVMSKLFKSRHTLLAGEYASLKFYSVRVGGGRALTVLSFANLPEVRQIVARRDSSGNWRVLDLLDGILE
jgi:hypothetical protein